MKRIRRREMLQTAAALVAGGVAGAAAPGNAQAQARTPFTVAQTFIPIAGGAELFPVRRIYCIGRNYAAHAREMGSDPNREPPFFFQKPTDAVQIAPPGETVDHPYPTLTRNYHYEIELVAALYKGGRDVAPDRALDLVLGYTAGLDMTRRDLQRAMGDEKKPWEIGKSFDKSAVLGPLQPATRDRSSHAGRDLAQGQRADQAEREPEPDDLERRRADQQPVEGLRADAGRHHLLRHARKRRPRGEG